MSQSDNIQPEYKTIRISAGTYYKLVEMAGMISAVTGVNVSISSLADLLIATNYDETRKEYLKLLNNPAAIQQIRNQVAHDAKKWIEIVKDVKVTE